jgi:7,8-dihydropterin-6-yl-methyl-4-(beta-D-ribofuranosyl)aminobenzene 5'-phosphate synthase
MGLPVRRRALCIVSALLFLTIDPSHSAAWSAPRAGSDRLTLTVLYDNYILDPRLTAAWGFSMLIEGWEETVLFDTGGDSAILLGNMRVLGVDPRQIRVIVLSHIHGDHVGGLFGLLPRTPGTSVYLPHTFPWEFKARVRRAGCSVREVRGPAEIITGAYTTGELGTDIPEQSLVITSAGGLIVITGCAHPGVVNIIAAVQRMLGGQIALMMGGFHLAGASAGEIRAIIARFKAQGVQKVGPSHCTGDLARRLFREAYGEDFVEVGVGRVLKLSQRPVGSKGAL